MRDPARAPAPMDILTACRDRNLFGPWFRDAPSWQGWFTFLAGLFGLTMTEEQLALFGQCTGREEAPNAPASEAWLVVGRRGGKSFVLALVAVYLAAFRDWRGYLADSDGSRPGFRDDLAHHSDLMSLAVPR